MLSVLRTLCRRGFAADAAGEGKQWSLDSRRTGVLARKVGMMSAWDEFGVLRPITVLRMEDNVVVQVKTAEKDGYDALQIGAQAAQPRHVTRQMQRHFDRWGAPMRRHVREFRVTPDALLDPGTPLSVRHFVPGQMIDVSGVTKGKGFQGAMKRWGFAGGRASHGNSKAHRTLGSTGNRTYPGRVFKGKKMPGQMGNKRRTQQNLVVWRVDEETQSLLVLGSVPGWGGERNGGLLEVIDSVRQHGQFAEGGRNAWLGSSGEQLPPFPTWLEGMDGVGEDLGDGLWGVKDASTRGSSVDVNPYKRFEGPDNPLQ